jgi:hypothetical protein
MSANTRLSILAVYPTHHTVNHARYRQIDSLPLLRETKTESGEEAKRQRGKAQVVIAFSLTAETQPHNIIAKYAAHRLV